MKAVPISKDKAKISCRHGTWEKVIVHYLVRVGHLLFVSQVMEHHGLFVQGPNYIHYDLDKVDELAEIVMGD